MKCGKNLNCLAIYILFYLYVYILFRRLPTRVCRTSRGAEGRGRLIDCAHATRNAHTGVGEHRGNSKGSSVDVIGVPNNTAATFAFFSSY